MVQVFIDAGEAKTFDNTQFVDCRHDLTDPDWGFEEYLENHIEGAVFAHLDEDLSAPVTEKSGRHPLPDLDEFHLWLQDKGLHPSLTIIGYDNFGGGIAARLWWMLTQLGYSKVYVMSDGIDDWVKSGYPTTTGDEKKEPVKFPLSIDEWQDGPYEVKDLKAIEQLTRTGGLIDSRAPERFHGEEEPYDKIPGRIPGAVNIYWQHHIEQSNLNEDMMFEHIKRTIDLSSITDYTVYCGSGVTACFNLAVFEQLGLSKPAFYPGSYSEWSRNHPELIETDDEFE